MKLNLDKDQYLLWSKNGIGANTWIKFFKGHFRDMAASYRQKGMTIEADLFDEIVEEFGEVAQEVKKLTSK